MTACGANRKRPACLIAIFSCILGVACQPPEAGSPAEPPNIVLVVIDTARADHFSGYGYHRETTPRIDELAADGVLFQEARSPAPWTLPAHASIFTGVPPGEHGLNYEAYDAGPETRFIDLLGTGRRVRQPDQLLARRLTSRGYTALGFSNNPWVGARTGLDAGFDAFYEIAMQAAKLRFEVPRWPDRWKTGTVADERAAGWSLALLKKHFEERAVSEPYFLFFNFIDPHLPYSPPEVYRERFDGDPGLALQMRNSGRLEQYLLAGARTLEPRLLVDLYDGELAFVDSVVGHLLDWLRARGDYGEALIVVTADHGEHLGEEGRYSHQFSMERALLGVPLVVKFPGNSPAGVVDPDRTVSTMDVYETVLAAAGVSDGGGQWSRDLHRRDANAREWSLSEYYYSDSYLQQFVRINPDFDAERERVVRRVYFTAAGEHRFVDGRWTPGGPQSERDRVRQAHERFAERLAEMSPPPIAETSELDEGTREALRVLGYVE